MSHVHTITTDAVPFDLDTIKALCQRRGWKFMEGQKTFVWFGRFVGDSPIPEGVKVEASVNWKKFKQSVEKLFGDRTNYYLKQGLVEAGE